MRQHRFKRQYTKYVILVLAIAMAVIVCRTFFILESPLMGEISFRESVCGMTLAPYYDEKEDIYYLFLPSYVSASDMEVFHSNLVRVSFSDGTTEYGENLEKIPLQKNITVTLRKFVQKKEATIQIWQCENLSTIYLEPLSGSLDDVNAYKEYELDTAVVVVDADGTVELNESLGTLSGHGNGSWGHAKNPYNLTFSFPVDIGPFESVTALCMLANYSDESRIRNAICYYAGDSLGVPYASPYMNVDVYVGGEYLGLYGLATKYEYEKQIETDEIQAIFEMRISTTSEDEETFAAGFSDRVKIMYGNSGDIQTAVGQLEKALRTQDWDLCHSVIDLHSFAEKYAFEEFIANHDVSTGGGSYQSKFFYLDQDGIIHCMLPWDYDLSLAAARTFFNNLETCELKVYRRPSSWFAYLMQDEAFIDEVVTVIREELTDDYLDALCQYVNDLTTAIDASWQCERRRWKNQRPYTSWDNASGIEDMQGFATYFTDYFYERRDFLLACFSDFDNYCRLELRATYNSDEEYFNLVVPKGTDIWSYLENANVLDTGRNNSYEFSGWYTEDGMSLEEMDIITEDTTFLGAWTREGDEELLTEETDTDEIDMLSEAEESDKSGTWLKKIYYSLGLDSFSRERLFVCGVFALAFLGLLIGEVVQYIRQRREE